MNVRLVAALGAVAMIAAGAPPATAGPRDPVEFVDGLVSDCEKNGCGVEWDGAICAALQALAPGAGPVVVNGQGDVFLAGEPFWDCPPYDLFG